MSEVSDTQDWSVTDHHLEEERLTTLLIFITKLYWTNHTNVTLNKILHFLWFILMMPSTVQSKSCKHLHKVLKSEPVTISIACHSHQNKFMRKSKRINLILKSHTKLILWDKVLPTHGLMLWSMMLPEKIGDGNLNLILLKWQKKFFKIWLLNLFKKCMAKIELFQTIYFIIYEQYDCFFIYS